VANVIQNLINIANAGDSVVVPGGTYTIDAINDPIRISKSLTLDMRLATVTTLSNAINGQVYFPIGIWACTNVTVLLGDVVGERDGHIGTTPAGFGHGVAIGGGATNVVLRGGRIRDCMGDGVLVFDASAVEIDHVIKTHNRRQGLTVSQVDGLWVHDGECTNNGGAAPGAGIDFEPDLPTQLIKNVRVSREHFAGNAGAGVLINCLPAQRINVSITADCTFVGKPIDGTDGVVPFWAKWGGQLFGSQSWYGWLGYPRSWTT
jgi:hypothetical protein